MISYCLVTSNSEFKIVFFLTGSGIAALMMEHLHGRRDLYDIRAYDVRRNASADVVRWALKDLRRQRVTNFLILCSPDVVEVVLTQVRRLREIWMPLRAIISLIFLIWSQYSLYLIRILQKMY